MSTEIGSDIDKANRKAVDRILAAQAVLVDIRPAGKAIPGFKNNTISYAGPPIEWDRMCYTQKFAISNLAVYEGLAESPDDAARRIAKGDILLDHNHKYGNVSGMCGVTSASMPVFVVENKAHGNTAYNWQQTSMTAFGDTYGSGRKEIPFVQDVLAPVMNAVVKGAGGIDVKELLARGLQMGDELHGTFDASRGVLMNWILPHVVETGFPRDVLRQVGEYFLSSQGRWYCGNLMMAACKAMMDSARDVKYSTLVTAMARNGVEFGIQISGLGSEWFTGPAGRIRGYTFPGFKEEDATLDLGDSAISETRGFGGTALAASPTHARLIGESYQDAVRHTKSMYEVSLGEDPTFRIPYLDRGVPVGIDLRKVVERNTTPMINTGMAHRHGGHPIIGTGLAQAPVEAFQKALRAFAEQYG